MFRTQYDPSGTANHNPPVAATAALKAATVIVNIFRVVLVPVHFSHQPSTAVVVPAVGSWDNAVLLLFSLVNAAAKSI